ncbi:hypothetical protein PLICRDRAFT_692996 [Plicaturopsis crispa FD-325 SS-3]|nr:hypothetical protein PLICRDRAFT_692996 [Plicaturopsis crispa FD-325 SS-3]
MPHNLRSSTSGTPSASTRSHIVTPGSTPRKAPHCTKCNQPIQGHPRGRCPNDSPSNTKRGDDTASDSLHPGRASRAKDASKLSSKKSRASLRTTSKAADSSSQSSDSNLPDETNEGEHASGTPASWKDTLVNASKDGRSPSSAQMPGALETPTRTSQRSTSSKYRSKPAELVIQRSPMSSDSCEIEITSFSRSMTAQERREFLDILKEPKAPAATIFTFNDKDMLAVEKSAMKTGLHYRRTASSTDAEAGLLILGREVQAVDALLDSFEGKGKQGGVLNAIRAMAGTLAAWTGFA